MPPPVLQVVLARTGDQRAATYKRAAQLADTFARDAKLLATRTTMAAHHVKVKGPTPAELIRSDDSRHGGRAADMFGMPGPDDMALMEAMLVSQSGGQ